MTELGDRGHESWSMGLFPMLSHTMTLKLISGVCLALLHLLTVGLDTFPDILQHLL